MFTNEFEFDETRTVIMDETAQHEDVEVLIGDGVFIRQWNDDLDKYDVVYMTPQMFNELIEAMKHPEGMFVVRFRK